MARGLRGRKSGGARMDQQVIEGEFQIADWKESTIAEFGTGGKLTEAKVTQKFSGGLKRFSATNRPREQTALAHDPPAIGFRIVARLPAFYFGPA